MQTKTCYVCGTEKSLDQFNKNKSRPDGHKAECRECCKPLRKKHYDDNKEYYANYSRAWREANADRHRENFRAWFESNADKSREYGRQYYAENSERKREYHRAWSIANPDLVRKHNEKRRALKMDSYIEDVSLEILRDRDGNDCCVCLNEIDFTLRDRHPMMASLEHIIPLSRGGDHSYGNTAISHLRCNLAKGTKTLAEMQLLINNSQEETKC